MQTYLEPTQESGRAFFTRGITGSVVMLNLLRYREVADDSATPELAPAEPITGEGIGHRTAALEDSRLLPIEESGW